MNGLSCNPKTRQRLLTLFRIHLNESLNRMDIDLIQSGNQLKIDSVDMRQWRLIRK